MTDQESGTGTSLRERSVASLLPHGGNMVLLDEIIGYDRNSLQGRARIGPTHVFLQADGHVPVWLAVEIMAQGIAALDGCHAADEGRPPALGFLLGSRRLSVHADRVPVGAELRVDVALSTDGGQGFGVFDCELHWLNAPAAERETLPGGTLIASGALNVYQPVQGMTPAEISSS